MGKIPLIAGLSLLLLMNISFLSAYSDSGKELFEKRCSKCHALDRALRKNKDLDAWKITTKRMAKYSEGAITEPEAEEIALYLAGRGTEASQVLPDKPE
ncbi:MAG: c-type cytochrome [Thermodesulfovibrionia bacterium]|nr:c-type cytochrome [Thermodesulfovibrionia bacterium]